MCGCPSQGSAGECWKETGVKGRSLDTDLYEYGTSRSVKEQRRSYVGVVVRMDEGNEMIEKVEEGRGIVVHMPVNGAMDDLTFAGVLSRDLCEARAAPVEAIHRRVRILALVLWQWTKVSKC